MMNVTSGNIHFTRKTDRAVYISSTLARQLKLRGKRTIDVHLGGKSVTAMIKPLSRKGKHIWLPLALKEAIRAPKAGQVYVASTEQGNAMRLGPLIGVLTSGGGPLLRPFGTRTGLIREILRSSIGKAYAFAFTPRDISWEQNTVLGYFANPEGGWSRRTVPMPDVIYNRLASRSADASPRMEYLKSRFLRKNIPIFNWSFYNKWDVYRMLEGESDAYKYIPDSTINPTPERLKEMLQRHRSIYLKPTAGSLGKGIYRVSYTPRKGYLVRFRRHGYNALVRYHTLKSLIHRLGAQRDRWRNYVAQKGIKLIEMDGSPIDFRFHLVRDGSNKWVVAGIGAKRAGKGSVTTHLRNGGTLMIPLHALGHVFGDRATELLQRMKEVSIKLAEAIQRNSRHHIGELGFDLGIDTSEDIWMFEANSKPGRSIFKHPSLKDEGRLALSLLYNHCLYLAKFRKKGSS
jgi:hypothetical protein